MKILTIISALASGLLLSISAEAHHAFRGTYDFSRIETIIGEVVELELVNPHARIFLDVTNADGQTERWVVEGPGKLSLARRGWTDEMFVPGDVITAHGNPHTSGENSLWLDKIIMPDGSEIIDPLVADELAIEAERRERAQRAQQQ